MRAGCRFMRFPFLIRPVGESEADRLALQADERIVRRIGEALADFKARQHPRRGQRDFRLGVSLVRHAAVPG